MRSFFQKLRHNQTFFSILLITFTTVLTYSWSIPGLGFYRDDWYVLWSAQARGISSFLPLFSTDRPYMGLVYAVVYRFLGDSPLNWHLYALFLRLLTGLVFFWILRILWPKKLTFATFITVLFVVYPGFLSQPNANTKQNHLFSYLLVLTSIAYMLQTLKSRKTLWKVFFWVGSLALEANYLFIYEYMAGLEAARLLFLGIFLHQQGATDWKDLTLKTLKRWWPFLLPLLGFTYWRAFIFESTRKATNVDSVLGEYLSQPIYMLGRLALETGKDFLDTSLFSWFVMPYKLIASSEYKELVTALGVGLVVTTAVWLYWRYAQKQHSLPLFPTDADPGAPFRFVIFGAIVLFFSILPVVMLDRQVDLFDSYKSYGLHVISGVVLLMGGVLYFLRPRLRQIVLLGLICLSVTTQVLNGDEWEKFWDYQKQAMWQISWRVPDFEENTLVFLDIPESLGLQQDYEVWGPLNLIYDPTSKKPTIQAEVLNSTTAILIQNQISKQAAVRDIRFPTNYRNSLIFSWPSEGSCLHTLKGAAPLYSEYDDSVTKLVGSYSRIEQIITGEDAVGPQVPASIYGTEPEHGWCYYYQKIDLANQRGEYSASTALYEEARQNGFKPNDRIEYLPVAEAYLRSGDAQAAQDLLDAIYTKKDFRYSACAQLIQPGYAEYYGEYYQPLFDGLRCGGL